jgi:hypothetical protein
LERRLAGDSADRLTRRPLLPDPARHPAAHDQHLAHPTGAKIIITCRCDGLTHLGVMIPDGIPTLCSTPTIELMPILMMTETWITQLCLSCAVAVL